MSKDLFEKLRESVHVGCSRAISTNGWDDFSIEFEEDATSFGPGGFAGTLVQTSLEFRVMRKVVRQTGELDDKEIFLEKERLAREVHHYLYSDARNMALSVLYAIHSGTREEAEKVATELVSLLDT